MYGHSLIFLAFDCNANLKPKSNSKEKKSRPIRSIRGADLVRHQIAYTRYCIPHKLSKRGKMILLKMGNITINGKGPSVCLI